MHLRSLRNTSQSHLDDMLARETERTQIPSLKIALIMFLDIISKLEIRIKIKCLRTGLENKP